MQKQNVTKPIIAILGAKGMLGSYLLEKLRTNFNVRGYSKEEVNIINIDEYESEIKNYDFIINCAAFTNTKLAEIDPKNELINYQGAIKLADICKKYNIHLIHISTNQVFTPRREIILNKEEDIYRSNPISKYGQAKRLADLHILNNLFKFTIIRPAWLIGSNFGKGSFIHRILKQGSTLKVAIDDVGNLSTSNMVYRFILEITKNKIVGDFNIGSTEIISRLELMTIFKKTSKMNLKLIPTRMIEFDFDSKFFGLTMSCQKIRKYTKIYKIKKEMKIWFMENKGSFS